MRVISPTLHGYIDHAVIAALALAPLFIPVSFGIGMLGFLLASSELVLTTLTSYPAGGSELLSSTEHAVLESLLAIGLIASPWLFGFQDVAAARNLYVALGAALAVTLVLTDFRAWRAARPRPASRWVTD